MIDETMSDDEFREDWEPFWQSLSEIAGYRIPEGSFRSFENITAWLRLQPQPPELQRLTTEGGARKDWFDILFWGFFGDVQHGLAAAHYHLQNLEAIESGVYSHAMGNIPKLLPEKSGSIAGGNSLRLDFEYQAFIFALRRTLEYSAHSIAAYFKTEVKGFRKLARTIGEAHSTTPNDVREAARAAMGRAATSLSDILGQDDERATRDILAHRQSIGAGQINVTRGPKGGLAITLVGGGENIVERNPEALIPVVMVQEGDVVILGRLAPRMKERLEQLKAALVEIYSSLIQTPVS